MASFCSALCLQDHGTIWKHRFIPETMTAVYRWLNILIKVFILLFADFTKFFWKEI